MKQLFILFFFFLNLTVESQEYKTIRAFETSNELLTDLVYEISFDKEGYTWLATDNGVYKFNGSYFKRFSTQNGLPSNDIFNIITDSKNRKWLTGYYYGLYLINNDKVEKIKNSNKENLQFIFEKQDTIFFKSLNQYQVFYFTEKNKSLQKYPSKDNRNIVDYNQNLNLFIYLDTISKKQYVCNNDKKVIRELNNNSRYYPSLSGKNICYAKNIKNFFDGNNVVKKFENAIYSFDGKTDLNLFEDINQFKGSKNIQLLSSRNDKIYKIFRNDKNEYAVIKNGVYHIELSKKIATLPFNLELAESLYIDSEENFWLIMKSNRLYYIPKEFDLIKNYDYNSIFEINNTIVKSGILIDDKIYLITNLNYLCEFNKKNKKIRIIKKYDSKLNFPHKINKTENGIIVSFLTGFDYFKFEKNNLNLIRTKEMHIDNLVIGGGRDSYYFNEKIYKIHNSMIYEENTKIYEDKSKIRYNNIVVTSNNKAIISNEKQVVSYDLLNNKSILNNKIKGTNTLKEINGTIIVGTNSNGLYCLSQNLEITQKTLTDENIYKICHDINSNFVFVGTNSGLNVFLYENEQLKKIKKISNSNQLKFGKINEILVDENSIYLFSQNGISIIDKKIINQKINGEIEIDFVKINDTLHKSLDNKILSRNQNNISIKTSIKTPHGKYEFKKYFTLNKNDEDDVWNEYNESEIFFKELMPGKYIFKTYSEVESKLNNHPVVKQFSFEIKPYYWETTWFKIVFLFLFSLILSLIFYIIRHKKTREIKTKLKVIELEMKALKAQMNPHFLFNTLNNMQCTAILEKDEEKINTYFSKFANLLRSTLDIVNSETTSLSDEFEYINAYVSLENFGTSSTQIELIYNLDKSINYSNTTIPVMLIQPIIENSIIHGFASLRKEKVIKITVKNHNLFYTIEIEDNGIGRNSNSSFKQNKHISYATKILLKRIILLKKLHKKEYDLQIIDLIDENSKPNGTKVIFSIPFQNKN